MKKLFVFFAFLGIFFLVGCNDTPSAEKVKSSEDILVEYATPEFNAYIEEQCFQNVTLVKAEIVLDTKGNNNFCTSVLFHFYYSMTSLNDTRYFYSQKYVNITKEKVVELLGK